MKKKENNLGKTNALPKPAVKVARESAELIKTNLNLESDTPRLEKVGPTHTWTMYNVFFMSERLQNITTERFVRERMTPLDMSKPSLLVTTKKMTVRGPKKSPVQTP